MKLLYVMIVCSAFAANAPPNRKQNSFSFRSHKCWSDPEWVTDVWCQFKPIRNKFGRLTYGFTYLKPANAWIYVESFDRTSANVWRRGAIYFKENLCKTGEFRKSFSFQFLPLFEEIIAKYLTPCPHTGRREFNQTIDTIDTPLLSFIATGVYKVIINFAHSENNATLYKIDMNVYYKGKSLSFP